MAFQAAIASGLAKGVDPVAAVRSACRFVEVGIRTAPKLGSGNGPLNHFHSTYVLPFSPYVLPNPLRLRAQPARARSWGSSLADTWPVETDTLAAAISSSISWAGQT